MCQSTNDMGVFHGICMFFLMILALLQTSNCATVVVVDGVNQWSDPKATIGDTIIFKHKNKYNLYIFRTKEAYNTCNFTQATPLSNPNSPTYTWHPSRPGNFFFAFYNGTNKPCQDGQKLAVAISPRSASPPPIVQPTNPPEMSPPAIPGGVVSSSPAYPWPFQPYGKANGPAAADGGVAPSPSGSIPFINSNPAVPLPTGEVDSATISPLPTSTNFAPKGVKVKTLGMIQGLISLLCVIVFTI